MNSFLDFLRRLFGRPAQSTPPPGNAPASRYALFGWKLQVPGPAEIKNLTSYQSKYFYLDEQQRMCFWVDCTEKGTTANSNYVRSELRGLGEWRVDAPGTQRLTAKLAIDSRADPDMVTAMQIHATRSDGSAPQPLLRIYAKPGALFAALKRDATGRETEHIALGSLRAREVFTCVIEVRAARLTVGVNGVQKFTRDIGFWPFACHFKTGCYPQANRGDARVMISALDVRLGDTGIDQVDVSEL